MPRIRVAGLLLLATAARAELDLRPCHLEGLAEPAECGTLERLEDPERPDGRRIPLHLAVVRALERPAAPDPLFLLAGGPGQAASAYAPLIDTAFREIHARRDLVLLDVRGTGQSSPLDCPFDEFHGLSGDPRLEETLRGCLAALAADPRHYTNLEAMDDLDAVRDALGFERINLWGGSYGTRSALVYLRRHPGRVRSMILDSVAPFSARAPIYMAMDAQAALDRLLADCRAEAGCREAYPRLAEELKELLERAPIQAGIRHPRTGRPVELTISRGGFASSLRGMLYTTQQAGLVPWAIHRAAGGDFEPFAALTLELNGWAAGTMSLGLTFSVLCAEDVPRILPGEGEALALGSFVGTAELDAWRRVCRVWPHAELSAEDTQDPSSSVPVLVFSGGLDPVTPPRRAEPLARLLPNARLITVPGAAHNAGMSGCGPSLMSEFLHHPDQAASLNTDCVDTQSRPPFFLPP